jgi:hypothetical protein
MTILEAEVLKPSCVDSASPSISLSDKTSLPKKTSLPDPKKYKDSDSMGNFV